MGRPRRVNATSQQIMDAFKTAINPNASQEAKQQAEEWLRKENARMTKAANERIADMKRKGLEDTAAYSILKRDLADMNQDKLIYRKNMDVDDLKNNMLAARKFLESQTSTAAGEKRRLDRMFKALTEDTDERKALIHPPEDAKEAEKLKKKFFDFLKSDAFEDFKLTLNTSNIIEEAYEAIANGARLDRLIDIFNEYNERTDIDAFDAWEAWTQGKPLPEEN